MAQRKSVSCGNLKVGTSTLIWKRVRTRCVYGHGWLGLDTVACTVVEVPSIVGVSVISSAYYSKSVNVASCVPVGKRRSDLRKPGRTPGASLVTCGGLQAAACGPLHSRSCSASRGGRCDIRFFILFPLGFPLALFVLGGCLHQPALQSFCASVSLESASRFAEYM